MIQTDYFKLKKDNICVPVMVTEYEEIKHIKKEDFQYNEFIEIRIDYIKDDILENAVKICEYIKELMPEKMIIVTYRTFAEGGEGKHFGIKDGQSLWDAYEKLLMDIVQNVPCNLIDAEINRGVEIINRVALKAHEKNIAVICSYHNFSCTPSTDEITNIIKRMDNSDADIIKMALMPQSVKDVCTLMKISGSVSLFSQKPFISMAMGKMGGITRIFGYLYGSSLTFGTVGAASAPGQMDSKELRTLMNKISGIKIAFTGFMGCGKSAVSRKMEELLMMDIADTDELIVERENKSIPDIFKEDGEDYFRKTETEILKNLLLYNKPLIISCGGGIIKSETNRKLLKDGALTCLLKAKPETILERVKDDNNRPLLRGRKNVEAIEALIKEREAFYNMVSDIVVETDNRSLEEISIEILQKTIETLKK